MNNKIKAVVETGSDMIGAYFPHVAAGKCIYDFVKEQKAKRHVEKLHWFSKSVKNNNVEEGAFSEFFNNNSSYGELLDILGRLDTEDAVSDFAKIFNEYIKKTITHKMFLFFVHVITHWILEDRDIMIAVWKDEGSPIITADMQKSELISVDIYAGHNTIEALKRLVAHGLIIEHIGVKINHNYDKKLGPVENHFEFMTAAAI